MRNGRGHVTKVRIQLSELIRTLEECCQNAGLEFEDGNWLEKGRKLDDLLSQHSALQGRLFRLRGDKLNKTLRKDVRFYSPGAVVLRDIHLVLDTRDWEPLRRMSGLFDFGVYFEGCTIESQGNMPGFLGLQFARDIVFRKTQFVGDSDEQLSDWGIPHLRAYWLVNLCERASITFEESAFRNDHVQIRAFGETRATRDEGETRRQSRDELDDNAKSEGESTKTRSDMLFPDNSSTPYPLRRVTLLRNSEIGLFSIVSGTEELIVRGGNKMESLGLPGNAENYLPLRVSLGMFEEIDPKFRAPLQHRNIFLQLRQLGTDTRDDALVRASAAQVDRFDHFLLKNDAVRLSNGLKEYVGHLQRRAILGWGHRVSNFNRSWLRCFVWLLAWYIGTTVLACLIVRPPLEWSEIFEIGARPLHEVPFLAKAIQGHLAENWGCVPTHAKVSIGLVGLVQATVTGMLTYSLVRSLRR